MKSLVRVTVMVPNAGPLTAEAQSIVTKAVKEVIPKDWKLVKERSGGVVDYLEFFINVELKL